MNINLKQTSKIVEINGVPARVWEGSTSKGIPLTAFITRIAVDKAEDHEDFESELKETNCPEPVNSWPAQLII